MCERTFHPVINKKYYHEYECNIRSRLGTVSGKNETWFDLKKSTNKITTKIIEETVDKVIPVFNILCDRQAILEHRKEYPLFDTMNRQMISLDEAMIYGRLGNMNKAKMLFEEYYQSAVDEYNDRLKNGLEHYLKKGERIVYMDQVITAEKDGYVTVYGASHGHIDCLDDLAVKLGLR